jgi:uncharacterized protein YggE
MKTMTSSFASSAIASLTLVAFVAPALAATLSPEIRSSDASLPSANTLVAPEGSDLEGSTDVAQQFFYPPASNDQAIMVVGQGTATIPADTAEIEMTVFGYDPYSYYYDPYSDPYYTGDPSTVPAAPTEPPAITLVDVQPVVQALRDLGVPNNAIDVSILPGDPYVYPYEDHASVTINLPNPTRSRVAEVVDAVRQVDTNNENIYMDSVGVKYTVDSCDALISEAYSSAVSNARQRASIMADSLGVELGTDPSIAESPFGTQSNTGVYSYCDSGSAASPLSSLFGYGYGYYEPFPYYDPAQEAEVTVERFIFVTYPVR